MRKFLALTLLCLTLAGCSSTYAMATANLPDVFYEFDFEEQGVVQEPEELEIAENPVDIAEEVVPPSPTEDVFYAAPGEEIVVADPEEGYWQYLSNTLAINICRVEDRERKWIYYLADIRMRGDEKVLAGFSGGQAPGVRRVLPPVIPRTYGAVYAQNGDLLNHEDRELKGIIIRDGIVYLDNKKADTLAFMPDNSLKIFAPGEATAQELLNMGVTQAFSFGPWLIKDGEINQDANRSRVAGRNPRSGIGMLEPGHFLCIVADGRQPKSVGLYMTEFAQLFADLGCTQAYNLDGGSSSSMVFMGESLNTHRQGAPGQRALQEMFMFGNSLQVPSVQDKIYHSGNKYFHEDD